jgi:hypothetical protein
MKLIHSSRIRTVTGIVGGLLLLSVGIAAFISPVISEMPIKISVFAASLVAISVLVWYTSARVTFDTSHFVVSNWLVLSFNKKYQYNEIDAVHVHYTMVRASDKSMVYLLKVKCLHDNMIKAYFKKDTDAIDALQMLRAKNTRFPVGYSKTDREAAYILRKSGMIS